MHVPRTVITLAACAALCAGPAAPVLAQDDGGDPMGTETAAPSMSSVMVEAAWSRPSPMVDGAGVAYMRLVNTGDVDDRLIAMHSDAAAAVEMHETTADAEGMMSMSPRDAIEVAAGGMTDLEPGGYHIMLIGLVRPLAEGDEIELTLEFEIADDVQVVAEVLPMGSDGPMDMDPDMDMESDMDMDPDMEMDAEGSPSP